MKTIQQLIVTAISILTLGSHAQETKNVKFIDLKGESLFPEGIHTLPNGDLLVGGFGDGSIQRINSKDEVSYFSQPGENGMVIAVGFAVDEKNNLLWVANFNFKTESGKPGSNFKVFDYTTGKLLKTIPENFIEGAFFNEVTLDKDGLVYVSDTFGPNIWIASFNSATATVFVTDPTLKNDTPNQPFGLNGLTITPNNKYLIASVMDRLDAGDGRLVRINLVTKEVTPIVLEGDEAIQAFAGSDGMFFEKNQLFMVNVFSSSGAIVTATFNKDYSIANLVLRNTLNFIYDRPTASTIRNGRLYTVNSQLNHIIDDADGQLNTPPKLPFQVVSVPLEDLLVR
ncbi:MAG: hypothetical protein CMP76_15360 [Flavobacterium sp.]|uniref:hypothetical protein n=1 Tax=Flavobacterium sp. TaxID=239 RepID=UPI000C5AE15C|nr:hypothetical protein [Flavobacterium sp.]MBF04659.1 hypothetical protein [Flavobacterium sp.]